METILKRDMGPFLPFFGDGVKGLHYIYHAKTILKAFQPIKNVLRPREEQEF
jgi:hypothetical protein